MATGDPALDQAIMAAVPYETSRVHLGLPSDDFIEIAHSDTPRGPLFVVKLANADRYKALRRNIDGGRLGSWIILEVDATSLEPIPLGRAEDR